MTDLPVDQLARFSSESVLPDGRTRLLPRYNETVKGLTVTPTAAVAVFHANAGTHHKRGVRVVFLEVMPGGLRYAFKFEQFIPQPLETQAGKGSVTGGLVAGGDALHGIALKYELPVPNRTHSV
jgi:hypothetical protein